MSDAANGGGSDVGSPLAGAVAPSRMSDLGVEVPASTSRAQPQRMSDLGFGGGPEAPKMQPLFGREEPKPELQQTQPGEQPAETPDEMQPLDGEQPEQQEGGPLTPDQIVAKYNEWMDSDVIPDEFLDRPIWVPDGKNGHMPVRLRDVPQNVMLYNDYQRKTTEVAQMRKQNEAYAAGRQRWVEDMNSGDPDRGLRAIRGVGAEKALEGIVIKFVQNMAQLETLPPNLRAQFLAGQQAEDRAYFAEQQLRLQQQQQQQLQEQQQQQAGLNAPDITYVQDSIAQRLPQLCKELKAEHPMIDHLLSMKLAQAAEGVRDPQTGQYLEPPSIQLGRAPSNELLKRLITAAKQEYDAMNTSKPLAPPTPPTAPLRGSGPAAKPGQRGNISAPQAARFSDLATTRRPG